MKYYLIISGLLFFAAETAAQKINVTGFAGIGNYQGDLQDKPFTFSQSHFAGGVGVRYDVTSHFAARAAVTFGKVSGDDKYNSKNASRNLSFSSGITDVHIGVEYNIFNLEERSFTPYIFTGISYYHFNPYAIDTFGRKVFLQPLSTEGQGFYQNRKKYLLNQFAIPFGGGVKYALNDDVQVGFEIGMRKTNTDYLDDVSTTYADEFLLQSNRGQQAVQMAFRGDELKTGLTYPVAGSQRGSAKSKDWYYFSGFTISYRLQGGNNGGMRGRKYKTGCPTNIY
jgi:Domain of unknown function (DUF6089)